MEAATRESGKWAERGRLERTELGGESYVKASEKLFGSQAAREIVSAQHMKDVGQTRGEQRQ